MRCILILGLIVLYGNSTVAASRSPDARPLGPPLSHDEAQAFALQLTSTLDLIAKQYARPVERVDLATAALKGLYQAAGVPFPRLLAQDVKKADDADNKLVELITQTRERLGNAPALKGNKALEVSLWAVMRSLDPYCFLASEAEFRLTAAPNAEGVGVELEPDVGIGPLRIKAVVPGSPAQKAGLRPGDLITHLDGKALEGKPAAAAEATWERLAQVISNQPFRFRVRRPGVRGSRKITLEPTTFKAEAVLGVDRQEDNSWNYLLDKKSRIAHVRLGALKQGTAGDLQEVLEALRTAGVRGLILDLRWCPGGLLDEAVEIASLFVGDRTIATIEYRNGRKQTCSRRQNAINGVATEATYADLPLVVLVNEETKGGGELIAAAIQDCKRGTVVGQRTVGKGSVQNALRTEEGNIAYRANSLGVRLSVGVFTRINGKNLQRFATSKPSDDWGVRPDKGMAFAVSPELSRKLRDLWELQSLRPGASEESLPLDDPLNDPQRQFASKVLIKNLAGDKKKEKIQAAR